MRLPGLDTLARMGEDGRAWYDVQRARIEEWCAETGHAVGRTCDVLAVTSPRISVSMNGRLAAMYLDGCGADALPCIPSVSAALRHYEETGEIRGPKTEAFARALRGEPDAVVLDVWLARALDVPQRELRGARYRRHAARVRRGAARLGWEPAEYQAAVWTGVRRAMGRTKPRAGLVLPYHHDKGE